jgi:HlyD family secretion protein
VDVEVNFDRPGEAGHLLVGYSADVEVILDEAADVPRVPTSALLEGNRVLVYRPAQGDLEERAIKPGLANWEFTQVLEGLKTGERIVVSLEKEGVKAGVKVKAEDLEKGAKP